MNSWVFKPGAGLQRSSWIPSGSGCSGILGFRDSMQVMRGCDPIPWAWPRSRGIPKAPTREWLEQWKILGIPGCGGRCRAADRANLLEFLFSRQVRCANPSNIPRTPQHHPRALPAAVPGTTFHNIPGGIPGFAGGSQSCQPPLCLSLPSLDWGHEPRWVLPVPRIWDILGFDGGSSQDGEVPSMEAEGNPFAATRNSTCGVLSMPLPGEKSWEHPTVWIPDLGKRIRERWQLSFLYS